MSRRGIWLLLALLLSAAAYLGLAYATPRAHTGQLLGLLALATVGYLGLLAARPPLWAGLAAALALRLLWLPATPALSDDFHRFRWDGLLVSHGYNAFRYLPDELVAPQPATPLPPALAAQLSGIYPHLNSPHYYSVYPPVCQAAFALGATVAPTSEAGFVLALRLMVLAAEAATAGLLVYLLGVAGLPGNRALWYLLHPLAVVELTGNLHFEALLIALLLLAGVLLARGRWLASAVALGLAVATKLLPLVALPLLVRRLGWGRAVIYGAVCGVTVLVLFSPFLNAELAQHIGRSLNLYFRNFEFNASLYYLARVAGWAYWGYNNIAVVGPALAALAAAGMLVLAWREPSAKLPAQLARTLLLMLTLYYLLATIVHPWYVAPLMVLSVLGQLRYGLVWGSLAMLSYAAYHISPPAENPFLLGLEYVVVLLMLLAERPWRPVLATAR